MVRWLEHKIRCHICGRATVIIDPSMDISPVILPKPWREVQLIGWIATFDVCSDACEEALRCRCERPERYESGKVVVEAEASLEREDETVPINPPGWYEKEE